jgi:hypothetical protein
MIRNRSKNLIALKVVLTLLFNTIAAGLAWADRDVFLANVGGQVGVGSAFHSSPSEPDLDTRVFARVMIPNFQPYNPDYGLDEPGFFALPAGNAEFPPGSSALPGNANVTVNLLPFNVSGNTATLFFWNGNGPVNFQPVSQPGVTFTIDTLPPPTGRIGSTGPNGGADIHPIYRLDDGGAGTPADGVYLTSPIAGVTGLADSPRFFFLHLADALVTNEDDADALSEGLDAGETMFHGKDFNFFLEAQGWVQGNLVPEPSSLTLVIVTMVALGGSIRRRKRA